jgi:hypothetical protein
MNELERLEAMLRAQPASLTIEQRRAASDALGDLFALAADVRVEQVKAQRRLLRSADRATRSTNRATGSKDRANAARGQLLAAASALSSEGAAATSDEGLRHRRDACEPRHLGRAMREMSNATFAAPVPSQRLEWTATTHLLLGRVIAGAI